jgi:hypothetical protein
MFKPRHRCHVELAGVDVERSLDALAFIEVVDDGFKAIGILADRLDHNMQLAAAGQAKAIGFFLGRTVDHDDGMFSGNFAALELFDQIIFNAAAGK